MLSEKPWRAEAVCRLLATLFASMLFGMLLARAVGSPNSPVAQYATFISVVAGTLSFHFMAILLTHYFLREHEMGWAEAFGFLQPRFGRTMLLATVVGLGSLPIILSLGHISAKLLEFLKFKTALQDSVQTLQTTESLPLKVLIGFLAIVVAPIAEEIIFRGIIYPAIKQHGFPRLALWGTAVIFAAIHGNILIFLPLTFLAVILTLLYESTNNLAAPMLTHCLFNTANFFLLLLQQQRP